MHRIALSLLASAVLTTAASAQCQVAKLTSSTPTAHGNFGINHDTDGDAMLIGAFSADVVGSATIFRFDGTTWQEEAVLTAPDGHVGDGFGAPAIHGDVAVLGAWSHDGIAENAGSAYVFRFDGTTWNHEQTLVPSDAAAENLFGLLVAVEHDVILVAAAGSDSDGGAYVFRYANGVWTEETKLVPDDFTPGMAFGWPVNLTDCGTTALIGAGYDNGFVGSSYVFRYENGAWTQEVKFEPPAPYGGLFGFSGEIHGNVAAIGCFYDDEAAEDAGAVYVYRRTNGTWNFEQKLTAPNPYPGQAIGGDVEVAKDVIVFTNTNDGAAHVYRYDGSAWRYDRILESPGVDDWFPNSISISGDTLVLGARHDGEHVVEGGAVHVYAGLAMVDYNGNGVADVCESLCPADTNGDGTVDFNDLVTLLAAWGGCI